jgi:ribosomal protein S18 acetylase RimI-like enzyme
VGVTIALGITVSQRRAAATLYWEAFGGKLFHVMGPDERALRFLERVMRDDHVLAAIGPEGEVLGIAGFKSTKGGFASGGRADLTAVYGIWGGAWRALCLRFLSGEIDNERFLIDGICVARTARGQGIGSALIIAACDEARARGYRQIRLEVVDTNWRAKSLYRRMGFTTLKSEKLGPLRYVFGFVSATTMVKSLGD